jgi:tRNA dimethylallyltransferase
VVGGSGLYITALLEDLKFPATDEFIRAALEQRLEIEGAEVLHAELRVLDHITAEKIPVSNGRRIVRALEVIEITKEPYSATLPNSLPALTPDLRIGLTRSRADLDERVTFRVKQMWQQGFVSEVESLIRIGLKDGVTASRALGYAQIIDYLDGEISEDEAMSETIRLTKRFVRKQESWFRRDPAVIWVEADSPILVETVLNMVNELR